jgi:gluconokinase
LDQVRAEKAEKPLIVSLDIGTSAVRALLFDAAGYAVRNVEARCKNELEVSSEGACEADAEALFQKICSCLDGLLAGLDERLRAIGAVAVTTFVNNILGLDDSGRPLTPLTTYADTRSAGEAERLRSVLDEAEVHNRTGCHLHPSYLPCRLHWYARRHPEIFQRVRRWVSIAEYMEMQLFGEAAVSFSVASWTGLLNRHSLLWDASLLEVLGLPWDRLSPLTGVSSPRRGLVPSYAQRWPALADVPWFPAVGDGAAANIGSGCVTAGRVALTMGSTSALRAVTGKDPSRIPEGLWCYRVDGRRSLPGGALSEGGNVYAWMRSILRLAESNRLEDALAARAPDGHGLTVLPFLAGERSPGWAGHARATIHGASLSTTPIQILQAGLEAVAYRIAMVFGLLKQVLPGEADIIAGGGALRESRVWLQIITDVLGRPVRLSQVREPSARGAALLALEGLGILQAVDDAPDLVGEVFEPDPRHHEVYQEAMSRQRYLYERLVRRE